MRRVAATVLVLVLGLAAAGRARSDDSGDGYRVRAIFDNAAFSAPGEDVRVAGARVGSIESIRLTPDNRAAITMKIDNPAFTPFHDDARCRIRAEGLLAVKFFDCDPGSSRRPELARLESGVRLLDVEHTGTPVDLDLVQTMWRRPVGQELALLLSEFGVGLSARGRDLNDVILRAEPSLRETNRVLRILARQNRELGRFSTDADAVVSRLASRRRELASFISASAETAVASGERSEAIAASFERFPRFLRRLEASMSDLGAFADEATPVLANLRSAGADVSRGTRALPGFADVAGPALEDLGRSSRTALDELERARPLIGDLGDLGGELRPASTLLDRLAESVEGKRGIQRLLEVLFYGAQSTNGFDRMGHYARLEVLSGTCAEYANHLVFGCDAQWGSSSQAEGAITNRTTTDVLDFLLGDER